MQILKIEDIIIHREARIRRQFFQHDIDELKESILSVGLLHAPVVRSDGVTLIAGESRLRAIQQLAEAGSPIVYEGVEVPIGHVPVVPISDLDYIKIYEAELCENIVRKHLHWREESEANARLHKLRVAQAEARGDVQTVTQTAREIAAKQGLQPTESDLKTNRSKALRKDLIIDAYGKDPDVEKAITKDDALKIIERKLEMELRRKITAQMLEKGLARHTMLHGSLFDKLHDIEEGTIDLIIADPPYGVDADAFKNQKAIKHDYDDRKDYSDDVYAFIAEKGMLLTKTEAHLFAFCDILRFHEIKPLFEECGWYVWKTPLIWYKGANVGIAPIPDRGPRRTYEAILYAIKGGKRVLQMGADVLLVPHDTEVERAAHKPPELYEEFMKRTCLPGSVVLDPCCGAGPVFIAAQNLGMTAIGVEIDDAALGIAVERLKKLEGI